MRIVTLAGSRWTSNYYITPATGSSGQLERRCWNENHVPAEVGPPGHLLSSPGERERKVVIARRVGGGSICCSLCSVSNSLSRTSLSLKWEVYFSKELCPLVFIASLCFCMHRHMYYVAIQHLSGTTTPGQSGSGINGNEGVLHILKSYRITGALSSNCLVSYPGHLLDGWGFLHLGLDAVGAFYCPSLCILEIIEKDIKIRLRIEPPQKTTTNKQNTKKKHKKKTKKKRDKWIKFSKHTCHLDLI